MGNSAVASSQTPTAVKQPAVAPPNLTLQIPITPASSSRSTSARQTSSAASAQSLFGHPVPRSPAQLANRHTHSRALTARPLSSRFAGQGNQFKGPVARVTHSNSRTWTRTAMTEKEKWFQLEKSFKHMRFLHGDLNTFEETSKQRFRKMGIWIRPEPYSPFVADRFSKYLKHRAEVQENKAKRAAFLEEQMNMNKIRKSRGHPRVESIFESRKFMDGRSAVLCLPTMWSKWYAPPANRPQAPWPVYDELKEEGNQRSTSHFGRCLPIPRVPANDTVDWKRRVQPIPSDLDEVNRLSDAIERGLQQTSIKEANDARWRRWVEESEIALADKECNLVWEAEKKEALKTGLPENLAEEAATIETIENARDKALKKMEQEEETNVMAEMRELLLGEFLIKGLMLIDENELEDKGENKSKANKETKSDEKESKNGE